MAAAKLNRSTFTAIGNACSNNARASIHYPTFSYVDNAALSTSSSNLISCELTHSIKDRAFSHWFPLSHELTATLSRDNAGFDVAPMPTPVSKVSAFSHYTPFSHEQLVQFKLIASGNTSRERIQSSNEIAFAQD